MMEPKPLNDLAAKWERSARRKFLDASQEKTPEGKRALEHCAICYLNCAHELSEALTHIEDSSVSREKMQAIANSIITTRSPLFGRIIR